MRNIPTYWKDVNIIIPPEDKLIMLGYQDENGHLCTSQGTYHYDPIKDKYSFIVPLIPRKFDYYAFEANKVTHWWNSEDIYN